MVNFLIEKKEAENETEAILIGNKLIDFDYLHHVANDHIFKNEYLFYRFREDEDYNEEDRDLSASKIKQSDRIAKQGFVFVKKVHFWNKRFLIVRNDLEKLFFYDNIVSTKPRYVIDFSSNQKYFLSEVKDEKNNFYTLKLEKKNEVIFISSETSSEIEQWIESFICCGAIPENKTIINYSFLGFDLINTNPLNFYDLSALDIDNQSLNFSSFKDKVVLIVNVASD